MMATTHQALGPHHRQEAEGEIIATLLSSAAPRGYCTAAQNITCHFHRSTQR